MEENFSEDYYKILKVKDTATDEEIKKSYKKLAIQNHPDRGGSEEYMKVLNEAYNILSNPEKKESYDKWYRAEYYPPTPVNKEAKSFDLNQNYHSNKNSKYDAAKEFNPNSAYTIELTPETLEKMKQANRSKDVYEVIVYTTPLKPIIIPSFCTCCIQDAHSSFPAYCTQFYDDSEHTLRLDFPICDECKKHNFKYEMDYALIIVFSLVISVISMGVMMFFFVDIPLLYFMGIAILTGLISVLGLNFLFKLKPLDSLHAIRSEAVEIISFTKDSCRFRFWNYFYAKAFADMNKSTVKVKKKFINRNRNGSFIKGKDGIRLWQIVILSIICISYVFYVLILQVKD